MSPPDVVSPTVARRYLLGRQGLWPGRRWVGKHGAACALRSVEALQVDPVRIVARSHDLALWSRVDAYDPEHLDALLYRDRAFFDYGGHLDIYPMDELPYWRLHMRRRQSDERQAAFVAQHSALLDEVREEVRWRGPLGNRDLQGNSRVTSYRGRKDTALALYHLWLTGELMTYSRRGFERLYHLRERIAPSSLDFEAPESAAELFFAVKALARMGWGDARGWASAVAYMVHRQEARRWLDELVADGAAASVLVEGQKQPYFLPTADLPLLATLKAGDVPESWQPVGSTTAEEVNVLSPLDSLLGRRRLRTLFDFEHLWEIYKPVERRRWGAYTMPILFEDRLVGRLDPRFDRKTETLVVNGVWLEDDATTDDSRFVAALANGLGRFARFHGARQVNLAGVKPKPLRERLQEEIML